ncbi:DUF2178 domain-containing protein [Companilactobacillus insicii]|uniref:DUF2178 domain-containing protein n=1 Tax=Companilactobacillus insicii TaxID=1732567 RepID=UPI000F7AB52E|nr:DUF2178 domain-containing protein [Companilactobacillus insicii]
MIYTDIFTGLHLWAGASTANWNQLVGGSFILFAVSVAFVMRGYYLFNGWNIFNTGDERTSKIMVYATTFMFAALILCDIAFPHAFMWQIFFLLKYSIVFITGGSYLTWQYHRDLN